MLKIRTYSIEQGILDNPTAIPDLFVLVFLRVILAKKE